VLWKRLKNRFFNKEKSTDFGVVIPKDKINIEALVEQEVQVEQEYVRKKKDIETRIIAIQRSTRVTFKVFDRLHNGLREKYQWYYKWHLNPVSSLVHWVALSSYTAVVVMVVSSYLFTNTFVNSVPQTYAATTKTWDTVGELEEFTLSSIALDAATAKLTSTPGGAASKTWRPAGDSLVAIPTVYPADGVHWNKVSDTSPDNDTTYVQAPAYGATAGGRADVFTITNDPVPTGASNISITVYNVLYRMDAPNALAAFLGGARCRWSSVHTSIRSCSPAYNLQYCFNNMVNKSSDW